MADNFFELPAPEPEEVFEPLWHHNDVRIERIISRGQTTPPGHWYNQEWDEWVMVVQGQAVLTFDGGRQETLNSGDYQLIPARCRHRVDYTSSEPPCLWLAVHAPLKSSREILQSQA